jgi:hypothetical protein
MDLGQAVSIVIKQNEDVKYIPSYFKDMTANGDHPNLNKIISNVIFSTDAFLNMIKQINKPKKVLSIEDLIAVHDNGFNLSSEVVSMAKESAQRFSEERSKYHTNDKAWVKSFFIPKE